MKKYFLSALLCISALMPSFAGNPTYQDPYRMRGSKIDYNHSMLGLEDIYFGFRIGPSFTTLSGDGIDFNSKVGLNFGVAAGFGLSDNLPLFLETGLYYNEKGGKSDMLVDIAENTTERCNLKFRLNYLELPVVFKYQHPIDEDLSIQPYLGFYLAHGLGGTIKNYTKQTSTATFSNGFKRFDAGMKIGCGAQYDLVYVELNYDLGLANITKDDFNTYHNRAFTLNVGLNF